RHALKRRGVSVATAARNLVRRLIGLAARHALSSDITKEIAGKRFPTSFDQTSQEKATEGLRKVPRAGDIMGVFAPKICTRKAHSLQWSNFGAYFLSGLA
ncbi:MAG: hypothetical protein WA709_13170, partial [Stellaceae bacterium]